MKKLIVIMLIIVAAVLNAANTAFIQNKVFNDMNATKKQLEFAAKQIDAITNDLEMFRSIYNSKKVDRISKKTVWIRESSNVKYQKTIITTNKFYYIDRLIAALNDAELQSLYKKYVGLDAVELKKDFEDALVQAEVDHKQLVYTMNANKRIYEKNKQQIIKERKEALSVDINKLKQQIAEDKRKLNQHVLGGTPCTCSRCNNLRNDIRDIETKLSMSSVAADYSGRVASFTDQAEQNLAESLVVKNDISVAKFGLDNSKREIYERFKAKFTDMFIQNLKTKLDNYTEQVKVLTKRYEALTIIRNNPDMMTDEIVDKLYADTLNSALSDAFNIDASEIEKQKKEEERAKRRHEYEMKSLELQKQRETAEANRRMVEEMDRKIERQQALEEARKERELERKEREAQRQHEIDVIKQLQEKPIVIQTK